jgi:hypothetical protein
MEKNISTDNIREKMEVLERLPGNWNKEKAWEKLQQRQVAKPAHRIYHWQYAAAVAIILLAGSVYFIFHKNTGHNIAKNNIVARNLFPKENVQKETLVIWIPHEKKEPLTNVLKTNKKHGRSVLSQPLTVINNKNILPSAANNIAPKDITVANVVIQNSKNIISPKKKLPVVYLNEVEGAPAATHINMPEVAQNKSFRFFRTDNNEPFTYASTNQNIAPEFFKIKIKN